MANGTIIDCDVHQRLGSVKELFPYLSGAHRRDVETWGLRLPGNGYVNGGDRGYRADAWPADGSMVGSDLDLMREQLLDAYGIEYGVLLGQELRVVNTLPDADYAGALAHAYNELLIHHWLDREPRLRGAILVAVQNPQAAAKEIRWAAQHPGMVEVLVSNGARLPYGQRYYDPIFEVCDELGLPFALHTGSEDVGICSGTLVGPPSYYIEGRQLRPTGYQAHLSSMVCEGLFERFPRLHVVFIEGGYLWLPSFLWRLDSDWRGLREEVPWVKRAPSEYVLEHCRFTSQPIETTDDPGQVRTVFEWAHAERTLMFASDYPHWDFDSPLQSLPAMPDEMRHRVMSETARELYRLPAPKEAPVGG